jgi:hypothetical protein
MRGYVESSTYFSGECAEESTLFSTLVLWFSVFNQWLGSGWMILGLCSGDDS